MRVLIPFLVNGGAPVADCLHNLQVTLIDWQLILGVSRSSVSHSRLTIGLLTICCFGLFVGCNCILVFCCFGLGVQHSTYSVFDMHRSPTVPAGSRIRAIIIGIFVTYSPTFSAKVVSM